MFETVDSKGFFDRQHQQGCTHLPMDLCQRAAAAEDLEDQQARMGTLTPPHIIMEIEDLRKELGENEG